MADSQIAIIADVHGNRWALEAVLADIERRGVKRVYHLGDTVTGPLDPAGTARIFMERGIAGVSGNDDRVLLGPSEWASTSRELTLSQLTPAMRDWLRALPLTLVVDDLFLCHGDGDPAGDTRYLLEEVTPGGVRLRSSEAIERAVVDVEQPITLCGHSHVPRVVYLPSGKLVINPGSVGLPAYTEDAPYPHAMEAGSPHARYTLLEREGTSWRVAQIHVAYDWEAAASFALQNGRGDWAAWVRSGRRY